MAIQELITAVITTVDDENSSTNVGVRSTTESENKQARGAHHFLSTTCTYLKYKN